jgi:hypothetical protein
MIPYGLFRPDTPGHGTTTEQLDRVVLIRSRATLPHPHPHSVARSLTPTPTQAHARKLAAAPARLCSLPPSVSPSSASSMRPVHPSDLAPATLTGDEDDSGGSDKLVGPSLDLSPPPPPPLDLSSHPPPPPSSPPLNLRDVARPGRKNS